jgi:hypothetical protein
MVDTPEEFPKVKAIRKPRPKKEEPVVVVSTDGKAVLPQELQTMWLKWFSNHKPVEQALIMETLDMLTVPPFNPAGYRAFFRTYRQFKNQAFISGKQIKARF